MQMDGFIDGKPAGQDATPHSDRALLALFRAIFLQIALFVRAFCRRSPCF
jgi:hypothetical protein